MSVTLVDLVVSCGGEEKKQCINDCVLNLTAWWGGGKLDLMLVDICGSGTYMCLQFPVYLWVWLLGIRASPKGCIVVTLCTVVSLLLLFSSIALVVFYTSVATVCLCHIGDIVDSLVFEHLCVFVVVRVGCSL